MLKKTITFDDIDGNKVTEDYHFSVARADMIELLVEKPEMEAKLLALTESMDGRAIVSLLKEFILLGVGKRPEGTRQFVKDKATVDDFRYSGAYDALLWELANNPDLANEFLEGLFPKSLLDEIKKSETFEELKANAKAGEKIVELPEKDFDINQIAPSPQNEGFDRVKNPDSFVEIATPEAKIEEIEGEVVTDSGPTPFPNSLPQAVSANRTINQDSQDDRPAWLKELREPTGKELLAMPKSEMALAFRMKEEGKLNAANKSAQ